MSNDRATTTRRGRRLLWKLCQDSLKSYIKNNGIRGDLQAIYGCPRRLAVCPGKPVAAPGLAY